MQTLLLGPSGVSVSCCCLGAMNMGGRIPADTSLAIMDAYWAAGGRFLDTANVYTTWNEGGKAGDSESLIGRWIRERGHRRDLFLATKVGLGYPGTEAGLKARQIVEECEKSLRRLGVETIDLYYAHRDDRNTPLEETLGAFADLVRTGKVRFLGASNFLSWRLAEARLLSEFKAWPSYCCLQQRMHYLRLNPAGNFSERVETTREILDYCRSNHVTLVAFSPVLKGAFARNNVPIPKEYHGPDTDARLSTLKAVAAETGHTPNQIAIAWLLARPAPVIPLFSASSLEQIHDNLGALHVRLSPEHLARLDQAGFPAAS